jgi:hypothetical protein
MNDDLEGQWMLLTERLLIFAAARKVHHKRTIRTGEDYVTEAIQLVLEDRQIDLTGDTSPQNWFSFLATTVDIPSWN